MSLQRILAAHALAVLSLLAERAGGEGTRTSTEPPSEATIDGASDAVLYLSGERLYPPFRVTLDSGRVLVNGVEASPRSTPEVLDQSEGDSGSVPNLPPEVARALVAMRETTARADALVESLRAAGSSSAQIDERVVELLRAEPLVAGAEARPEGGVLVRWTGVPGFQLFATGPRRDAGVAPPLAAGEEARALFDFMTATLSRGEFYAAGEGYRISLAGAVVDSMLAAIDRFEDSSAETLRVGKRTYFAFGEEIRTRIGRRPGR